MRTFENQAKLPRLPVPLLSDTIAVYMKSVEPFLTSSEYAKYSHIAQDFIKSDGLGQELQTRLIKYDQIQPHSWLENWWLKLAYLSWRNPALIDSNWFVIADLTSIKPTITQYSEGFSEIQVTRAAGFTSSFLDYKYMIDNELIEPEVTKSGPLDMHQFKRMFGITRVPKDGCDILVGEHPSKSRHIIVLIKDQIFVVDVYDSNTGGRLRFRDIEKQFYECIEAEKMSSKSQPPIGILSGQHRDKWAKQHHHLSELSLKNRNSFHLIETALFAVYLDHRIISNTVTALAKNVFHGYDGHNRWFDKSLGIVATNDGRVGVHGEHSPCDALVPAILTDYSSRKQPYIDGPDVAKFATMQPIKLLEWQIDDTIKDSLTEAQDSINICINDSDLQVLHYAKYGSEFMKKKGRVSPDAYAQMCIQLAFYRLHGQFSAVYETASTRKFLHGRTETVRSYSTACKDFVLTFEQDEIPAQSKYIAFERACRDHVLYLQRASNGMGCDRHLLGLKLCLNPGEGHALFDDLVYSKSSHWQLSTSGLIPSDYLQGSGFGTVYYDGYGMNYMIVNDMIKVGVESKFGCMETNSARYIDTLSAAFDDIKAMCDQVHIPSKL